MYKLGNSLPNINIDIAVKNTKTAVNIKNIIHSWFLQK